MRHFAFRRSNRCQWQGVPSAFSKGSLGTFALPSKAVVTILHFASSRQAGSSVMVRCQPSDSSVNVMPGSKSGFSNAWVSNLEGCVPLVNTLPAAKHGKTAPSTAWRLQADEEIVVKAVVAAVAGGGGVHSGKLRGMAR